MHEDHEQYMRIALQEAEQAKVEGNDPYGSVIVRADSVVARGRNLVKTTFDPTTHAETVAIRNASSALGQADLSGCTLYATFQPCPMCCGAIMNSGITTLVLGGRPDSSEGQWGDYSVENLIKMLGFGNRIKVVTGVLARECLGIFER